MGVAFALEARDSLFPTHRDLTAQLTKGLDLKRVMAQYWGRIDGYLRGRDGNSHIGDWQGNRTWTVMSHLPIAYPAACGAALAYKRKGLPNIAMAICGDGSTSNGRWHEALNVSSIFGLPVVWVVNNNSYAYSTPNRAEFPVETIAERGPAYGMPGVRVDGRDVLEVYAAAKAAIVSFTQSLGVEWATRGVRVNALVPGWIETDLTGFLRDGESNNAMGEVLIGRVPMQRWGSVREIAEPAVFLASDASSFITGQVLVCDGGLTVMP